MTDLPRLICQFPKKSISYHIFLRRRRKLKTSIAMEHIEQEVEDATL